MAVHRPRPTSRAARPVARPVAPPAKPAIDAAASTRERRRLFLVAAVISSVIALPVGVSVGMAWVEMPWSADKAQATPDWVSVPTVRATTRDGVAVKTRVAIDVDGAAAKTTIQRNIQQVGLLLETTVASRTRAQLASAGGITQLSNDMHQRLSDYLAAEGADVVRSVAIQDLIVNPQ